MGDRHDTTVHRTRLLLREPLGDAGVAESMLAMRCLEGRVGHEASAGAKRLPPTTLRSHHDQRSLGPYSSQDLLRIQGQAEMLPVLKMMDGLCKTNKCKVMQQ